MVIRNDFQRFNINALTLREVLKQLGFSQFGKYLFILRNKDLLDSYPVLLEDDGMGYGVNKQYIIEADSTVYKDNNNNVFNIFRCDDTRKS